MSGGEQKVCHLHNRVRPQELTAAGLARPPASPRRMLARRAKCWEYFARPCAPPVAVMFSLSSGLGESAAVRIVLGAVLALSSVGAAAQEAGSQAGDGKPPIVVTGERGGKAIPMSDWRVAETDHVLVYSKGDEKRLTNVARRLETLHFLLGMLFNRVAEQDETAKLKVTLIGDTADFDQLDLKSLRWQRGPYPDAFPTQLYYDPREDGAVLATTDVDQRVLLQPGTSLSSISIAIPPDPMAEPGTPTANFSDTSAGATAGAANEIAYPLTAEGRIYAGFAQHYLMTYFPAAYPRWYLDGFGEMFSTIAVREDAIEYGHAPEGFRKTIEWFGRFPLRDVLDGDYLVRKGHKPAWTPFHAWRLTHLLFFDEQWRAPLRQYLAAVASGAPAAEAAKALGDTEALEKAWNGYRGTKVPYERMTFPAGKIGEPLVRRLTREQAEYARGRLVLGARAEIPPAPPAGADAKTAEKMEKARRKAIEARTRWLANLRADAARPGAGVEAQLLLAEGACRSGDAALCLSAADRALAIEAGNTTALAWKGTALARQAAAAPAGERDAALKAARSHIVRANRADPEGLVPLIAYHRSFADAGQAAPDVAVAGLMKANETVPSAPSTRLSLGSELAKRGDAATARRILRPVAHGAYDSPEKPKAQEVLRTALD